MLYSPSSFQEDMIKIVDRLPAPDEYRRVRHLCLQESKNLGISDDDLAQALGLCPHLESIVLSGVVETSDRTLVVLAQSATNLQGIDLTGCTNVTDVGVLELTTKSLPLQWIRLNGVVGLTDPAVSAIAKSCSRLIELELCDLPLLTALSIRDVWSFSRKLRTLRLAHCPLLTDKAFPSATSADLPVDPNGEKPLPPRPVTWLERLPPLIIPFTADHLRVLDLAYCSKITDEAIEGIMNHAPRIQNLVLSGCTQLTDRAVQSICVLSENLDALSLSHVSKITDAAVVKLARSCTNLRCVDVAFCWHLTDMSVFELAGLSSIRRLNLVRVHKLTDIAIFALAEHATLLERLHLSYCDRLSLDAVHLLLKRLRRLQHLTVTGIPAFRRRGVHRFSDLPPSPYSLDQQAAFRVYSGENVVHLLKFLDKEEHRRRESEVKNIPFTERSDDEMDLY